MNYATVMINIQLTFMISIDDTRLINVAYMKFVIIWLKIIGEQWNV